MKLVRARHSRSGITRSQQNEDSGSRHRSPLGGKVGDPGLCVRVWSRHFREFTQINEAKEVKCLLFVNAIAIVCFGGRPMATRHVPTPEEVQEAVQSGQGPD
jgi:hypothetical protein